MRNRKINNAQLSLTCLVIFIILLSSCSKDIVYEKHKTFQEKSWNKDSVCVFEYEHQEQDSTPIMFSIDVRNTVDYGYSNLFLFTEIVFPGKEPRVDTVNCLLKDAKGFWREYVNGGTIKETSFVLPFVTKPRNGRYIVKIKQGMRKENLTEIVSIGTRIEKVEQ